MKNVMMVMFVLSLLCACAGPKGDVGAAGTPGAKGDTGTGCTVTEADNGSMIVCADSMTMIIDGVDGKDGADTTPSAYEITEIIDPCGKQSEHDEVLFRMSSGKIVGIYYDRAKPRGFFTVWTDGEFMTKDGTRCVYSIDEDWLVLNEHNL